MIGLFDIAFEQRHRPDNLTFHSDQGTQYTAYTFRKHLRDLGVNQSFSNPGTPLDNAVAESFLSCMKREELSHNYYDTVDDLKRDVAEYVVFFQQHALSSEVGNADSMRGRATIRARKKLKGTLEFQTKLSKIPCANHCF